MSSILCASSRLNKIFFRTVKEVRKVENKVREIYKENFTEYLLCLALDVGEGMLKNGGEVARVEDTIERICRAYGAVHVEVFTIISMINAAIRMPDGSYSSQLRRVKQTTTNLNTLEELNALSRRVCREKPSLDVFDNELHDIKRSQPYPTWLHTLSSALVACAFCLFFGGGIIDSVITFFIGLGVAVILNYPSARLNSMAKTVISSFVAATLAGVALIILPETNVDAIIIGAIMLLVPGLMFGTSMRDLLCGDLIAGTLKILQALIQTLMIGFGYMLSYALLGDRLIPEVQAEQGNLFLIQIVTSFITSVTFAILLKANKRHLLNGGICGTLTFAAYFGIYAITSSLFWAAFVSTAVAALFAEVNARAVKAPSIIILMAGVIPTVPGGYLYRAVRDFVRGFTPSAISWLGGAAAVALGIAGGVISLSLVFNIINDYVAKKRKNNNKCK